MTIDWFARARSLKPTVRDFIDGRWRPGDRSSVEKLSPRDGSLFYQFAPTEVTALHESIAAGRRAFEDRRWAGLSAQRRCDVLLRLASLIQENSEELALLECLDVGKPIRDAVSVDVPLASAVLRYCAEAIDKLHAKVYSVDASNLSYQLRKPVGVVGAIVGWNFPLVLACQKIAPALATGNSLILKPSEVTSLSAARVAELAMEAGVPEGVFNVIHGGAAVGDGLARHPGIDLLTFTGSSRTGKRLMVAAGESNMKRLILECGGKAPNIVLEDCPDLEGVAEGVVSRAFWNQGEVCSASSRLLIHQDIKDELLEKVVRKAAALSPGDPLDNETTFGALVSEEHKRKVIGYIESAEREGARMIHHPTCSPPFAGGYYVPPAIFDDVSPYGPMAQQEIFGPVLAVFTFSNVEEAIKIANGTPYGLSAIVWTKDLARAHTLAFGLRAGAIAVNATDRPVGPADGVMSTGGLKESGFGVEGGIEGLEAYMTQAAVQLFV